MITPVKFAIGKTLRPFSRARRLSQAGQGGGGGFGGILDDWSAPYRKGGILLGQSLHDPSYLVGLDSGNLVTCAAPGAGKGLTGTIPNLLLYPHNAIVIDVKGTHTIVTAAARGHGGGRVREGMGQNIYVLDPFGVTAGRPGVPKAMRFDPLAAIDPASPLAADDFKSVATGLIVSGEHQEKYWANSARALVAGLCAYVKTAPFGEEGVRDRTLVEVRRLLTLPDGPPTRRMGESEACGGIISAGAAQLRTAGPDEKGSILSTAIEQTSWISGQGAETVSASDFSLDDLKRKPATMYFVVPPHRLAEYGKFLRLMVNESLRMAGRIGSAGLPLLFILDEFYTLGRLEAIAEAAANIRSYGVRLYPQVQSLGQLRELYRENWETFLPNLAVFGIGDLTTARYASEMLGHTIVMRQDRDGVKRPAGAALLRDPAEIAYEVEPAGGRMVVYRNGASPLLLRRCPYPRLFSKSQYNPDPDVEGS